MDPSKPLTEAEFQRLLDRLRSIRASDKKLADILQEAEPSSADGSAMSRDKMPKAGH